MDRQTLEQQLPHTLPGVELQGLGNKISGKVRDSYIIGDKRVLIATDRLSAFDRILTTLPFKGQLLNSMAAYWFGETASLVPNHVISRPHPNVFIAHQVQIVPVEVVVRGYLAGSAWRDYQAGRPISGIRLRPGLKRSHRFDEPLITPSTKEEVGKHDLPISVEEVVARRIVSEQHWQQICDYALRLFRFGTERARERGLLLVDTKYEFGIHRDASGRERVLLADEIHTQDSSRYWIADSYERRFASGQDPEMLDKEFFRRWLIEHNYMGDGQPPVIPDQIRLDLTEKYVEAFEKIVGHPFNGDVGPVTESALAEAIRSAL